MVFFEIIKARGHPHIKASHKTTLEVTKEPNLTPRGDCIIGVSADKAVKELCEEFKNCIHRDNAILIAVIRAHDLWDVILAQGSSRLLLTSDTKVILRKSTYIEPATLGVRASKAASDLRRDLVERLRDPSTIIEVELYCFGLDEITSIYKYSRRIF